MEAAKAIRDAVEGVGRQRLTVRKLSSQFLGDDIMIVAPCLCVQDSPDNPCPCPPWPMIMVPRASILDEGETSRRTADGDDLTWLEVEAALSLIQLSASRVRADQILADSNDRFGGHATTLRRRRLDEALEYMRAYWYWVTVGAWGPLPERKPEPPW